MCLQMPLDVLSRDATIGCIFNEVYSPGPAASRNPAATIEAFERKLHPKIPRSRVHLLRHAHAVPPPAPLSSPPPAKKRAGRRAKADYCPLPRGRLAEKKKHFAPKGTRARERVARLPSPLTGLKSGSRPSLKRTSPPAVASGTGGLARIATPVCRKAPHVTDRAQVPWNGARERVTAQFGPCRPLPGKRGGKFGPEG
ncbi:hypothetical protein H6P81_021701 [Aristolochia fimbriata]|uniref:Uncharacterized protein n=1 Tax=Aristolochia fimbriata TaxID=158543 RepID=A0AAV7DP82_ARIFI|nr:hypothetical protein H6P81_021701 [Aristolochia fimbriata]